MRGLWVVSTLVACACTGATEKEPSLPPLALSPRLAALEEIAASGPARPSKTRLAELGGLMELAFVPGRASPRVVAHAKTDLLEAKDAFWTLEESLARPETDLRKQAAYELGRLGPQGSILPLLLRLKYEREPSVRVWIASALARLGNDAGLPSLNLLMQRADTAQNAGVQAIEILRAAGRPPADHPSYVELQAALAALHRVWRAKGIAAGHEAEPATALTRARIAARLVDLQGFQLRAVDDARFVLARAGLLGVPLLAFAAGASEVYLRDHSLEILRRLGRVAASAGEAVLPLLGDPLSRADAARTLGSLGAREALPYLLRLTGDPDPELRAAAAEALGTLSDRAALVPLGKILEDSHEVMDVRVMAAFALALLEHGGRGRIFLLQRQEKGDYHGPTLDELLDRIGKAH